MKIGKESLPNNLKTCLEGKPIDMKFYDPEFDQEIAIVEDTDFAQIVAYLTQLSSTYTPSTVPELRAKFEGISLPVTLKKKRRGRKKKQQREKNPDEERAAAPQEEMKDEPEVLRYVFKDYIKDLVSKTNEWQERPAPESIEWPDSDDEPTENLESADQETPEDVLFERYAFNLPEMSAIIQSFDADAGSGLFGELVRGEDAERYRLKSDNIVIATQAQESTILVKLENTTTSRWNAGYEVRHLNPRPCLDFGSKLINEEWRPEEVKTIEFTERMPDHINELCYVAKFGLFSLFGTQVGQPFSLKISILEESHVDAAREMMEICLQEPSTDRPLRLDGAAEDMNASPCPSELLAPLI